MFNLWNSLQVVQRSCGCPILGGFQGQAGWGPGQPDLVLEIMVSNADCSRVGWK